MYRLITKIWDWAKYHYKRCMIFNFLTRLDSSWLTSPSNVLPYYLKQTFPMIIWIFTKGDGIEFQIQAIFVNLFYFNKKTLIYGLLRLRMPAELAYPKNTFLSKKESPVKCHDFILTMKCLCKYLKKETNQQFNETLLMKTWLMTTNLLPIFYMTH